MNVPPDQPGSSSGVAAALVRRPVTLFMLFLTLIGLGVMAYSRIPLTFVPEGMTGETLSVSLPFRGAGPREVEDQITRPVEDALSTIPGIESIRGISSEGQSRVTVEFSSNTDMDVAYGEVRDRIERIRAELPPEMDRYRVQKWDMSQLPVLFMGVHYPPEHAEPFTPLEQIVVPRLESVEGVANVGLNGVIDDAVRIFVDIEKVKGFGIDLGEVIRKLQTDNFTLPAGQVDEGDRRFAVRIDSTFKSVDELRRYPVGENFVLADVAEIVLASSVRDSVWRRNGRPAMSMEISKEAGANTLETTERVRDVLAGLIDDPRLEGFEIVELWGQADDITASLDTMRSSALWGGLFAVIVLLSFLRDLRMTLLAALAIPSALLGAMIALHFGGGTLNIISLAGFTIGIGMLVDNAVVVIELIVRRRSLGDDDLTAAANGARDVGVAVLTATLTTIVVFLPMVFLDVERNQAVMMKALALPISFSLMASLVVALVFLPAFSARMRRRRAAAAAPRVAATEASSPPRGIYPRLLAWTLRRRLAATLLFAVAPLALAIGIASNGGVPMAMSEGGNWSGTNMEVKLPSTYSLADANGVFERIEAWLNANRDELHIDSFSCSFSRRRGNVNLWLDPSIGELKTKAVEARLRTEYPKLPGVTITLGREGASNTGDVELSLQGADIDVLAQVVEQVAEELRELRTVNEAGESVLLFERVRTDLTDGLDEVQVSIDRDRSSELGVSPQGLQGMVAWGLSGQRLPDMRVNEREIPVIIEYARGEAESLEFLRNMGVPSDTGNMIPLAAIAELDFKNALGAIVRRDGHTMLSITATPAVDDILSVSRELAAVTRNTPIPEGYEWVRKGGREDFDQVASEMISTLLMSVALIYLLIAILLESAILPFSILMSIVLAGTGVIFALALTATPLDPMGMIGGVLLAGVVVNNAIVLLDRVQRLREQGRSRREALIHGGADRVRPIMMTALTTICGLLPMAVPTLFSGGENSNMYRGMAVAVAGGLAVSTAFTLLVVPLFYTFFDDLAGVLSRLSPFGERGRSAAEPPTPRADRATAGAPVIPAEPG
ncbi:MAG: transporter [Planctomycetota bacterium]|nr:MAG: transporter [Planctomycetota bacterium]